MGEQLRYREPPHDAKGDPAIEPDDKQGGEWVVAGPYCQRVDEQGLGGRDVVVDDGARAADADVGDRRAAIRTIARVAARASGSRLVAGGLGVGLVAELWSPSPAGASVDTDVLQTASSLEIVLSNTYQAILALQFMQKDNPLLAAFVQRTKAQHDQHLQAFFSATKSLGAPVQTAANPKYAAVVDAAKPNLVGPNDVVGLSVMLEQVATETYVSDLTLVSDRQVKSLLAKVAGVEAQHMSVLRVLGALIGAGDPSLLRVPLGSDLLRRLPLAVGSVGFPDAVEGSTAASPPDEGAVR